MLFHHSLVQWVAAEISRFSRYYDHLIQWMPLPHDFGALREAIDCPQKSWVDAGQVAALEPSSDQRRLILLNGNFNHHFDIQNLLSQLKPQLSRSSRLVVVAYNPYFKWLYRLANRLGLRHGEIPFTFMTHTELQHLAKLSGYEVVRIRAAGYFPWKGLGLGRVINTWFPVLPGLRHLSWTSIVLLRPVIAETRPPSLSIIIPARNESGNIELALKRLPALPTQDIEMIFVEGHSRDNTWETIQTMAVKYQDQFPIKTIQQRGIGKADAVRLGFAQATKQLLIILDADLTMPPEQILRFYEAYTEGKADFINGNRLLYPMEGEAMRFLNQLGNITFAKLLAWILETSLGDSLCGTKLVTAQDYLRMIRWRQDFGDFDPFGDYELIFPAVELGLGIIDIPIRYGARTYGSTNIKRFTHGFMLLKMILVGFIKIKLGGIRRMPS